VTVIAGDAQASAANVRPSGGGGGGRSVRAARERTTGVRGIR